LQVERVWESPVLKVNGSVGEIKIDSSPQVCTFIVDRALASAKLQT
jgi:hypothetical protein